MKWLDLFSGIGMYAVGLEQAGHDVIGFCENDTWARKILKKHWPTKPISWSIELLNKALTELLEVSPAKTLASLVQVPDYRESVLDCGGQCLEPFAWYDRSSSSWKTWQRCLVGEWALFSGTWPKAGMIVNGIAYRRQTLARRISENEYTLLPTITVNGNHNYKGASKTSGDGIISCLKKNWLPTLGASEGKGSSRTRFKGSPNFRGAKMSEGLRISLDCPIYLNPSFAEIVMGLPKGYTELETETLPASSENLQKD